MYKRIGTFTSALALIFLGFVLLIRQIDPGIASRIFSFWPMIIIVLGIEVIVLNSINKESNTRLSFNGGIIFIILIFLISDAFIGVKNSLINIIPDLGFNISNGINIGNSIEAKGEASFSGEKISFLGSNGDITIRKSDKDSVRFEGRVYMKDTNSFNDYEIKPITQKDEIIFDFRLDNIRKIEGIIYIPDNVNLKIDINNLNLRNEGEFLGSDIYIDSNNGNFNLEKFKTLSMDNNNGKIDIQDIQQVNIKSNNAKIDIRGEVDTIDVITNISAVDIINKTCKNVKVISDSGKVTLKTEDNNFKVQGRTSTGTLYINGDKISSKEINKNIGNGEGLVNIRTGIGTIRIEHKE